MNQQVMFHLTGFGQLGKIPDTTTSRLMKTLPVYLNKHRQEFDLPFKVASYTVLEFDASLAWDQLNVIHDIGSTSDPNISAIIYVHCGLDVGGTKFKLEEVAFDDLNKSPRSGQSSYNSSLPISWITDRLSSAGWGSSVSYSDYLSRSVYNSVYFSSLSHCASSNRKHSIFINCPPLNLRDEQEQLCFIKDLLLVLAEQVHNNPSLNLNFGKRENSGNVSPVQTVLAQADSNYEALESFHSNKTIPTEYQNIELHNPVPHMLQKRNFPVPAIIQGGLNSNSSARTSSNGSTVSYENYTNPGHYRQPTTPKRISSPGPETSLDWKILLKNNTLQRHPGYTPYEKPVYKGDHENSEEIMKANLVRGCAEEAQKSIHQPIQSISLPFERQHTKDEVIFGQTHKMLLLVRIDIVQLAGHMTRLCVQASATAKREVEAVDPEVVYRWESDGNQCIIATLDNEHEMNEVLSHASQIFLPVIMQLEQDTNNMSGVISIGPAPEGVLLELSNGLEIID